MAMAGKLMHAVVYDGYGGGPDGLKVIRFLWWSFSIDHFSLYSMVNLVIGKFSIPKLLFTIYLPVFNVYFFFSYYNLFRWL